MKIHEYQAKELFKNHGIEVPASKVCTGRGEISSLVSALDTPLAVKAQIHAGGRGKGGGVVLAANQNEALAAAENMLGMRLVTEQTGRQGVKVNTILFEQCVNIKKELYLSIVIDRERGGILIIACPDGGTDIELLAENSPELLTRVHINPLLGIHSYHIRELASALGLSIDITAKFSDLVNKLYKLFIQYDASLVEINPLVISAEGNIIPLDAKIDIDSNSLFRQPVIREMMDSSGDDPMEIEAAGYGLNYIRLNGTVGSMVNGAGLAMATMDLIKSGGLEPANFLDVGGGASAEMVENGFRIIMADPNVRGIFINIFGGILRCDTLAAGVVAAARKLNLKLPVVVRMEGTNVEIGRKILSESGLALHNARDLGHAVELLKKALEN